MEHRSTGALEPADGAPKSGRSTGASGRSNRAPGRSTGASSRRSFGVLGRSTRAPRWKPKSVHAEPSRLGRPSRPGRGGAGAGPSRPGRAEVRGVGRSGAKRCGMGRRFPANPCVDWKWGAGGAGGAEQRGAALRRGATRAVQSRPPLTRRHGVSWRSTIGNQLGHVRVSQATGGPGRVRADQGARATRVGPDRASGLEWTLGPRCAGPPPPPPPPRPAPRRIPQCHPYAPAAAPLRRCALRLLRGVGKRKTPRNGGGWRGTELGAAGGRMMDASGRRRAPQEGGKCTGQPTLISALARSATARLTRRDEFGMVCTRFNMVCKVATTLPIHNVQMYYATHQVQMSTTPQT